MVQATELAYLSIREAGELFRRKELSPVELTEALLERTRRVQEKLVPYVTLTPEIALEQAGRAEAIFARGGPEAASPLLGIPIAYKDIVMTRGIRTTCGSAVHEDWIPDIDAAVVERWQGAGTVMLGKLSTHEFALGLQPPGHMLLPARNPWNPAHIPGGSSSGSGAALAAGLTLGAIGTDTGGSIRGPAAFCGISGLKPTYGRVSRYGIVTLAWSLDHAGPMARSAEDCAILLNALAGHDPRDPAAAAQPVEDYTASLDAGVKGLRAAIPTNYFHDKLSDEAKAGIYAAADVLRGLGATVEEISLPHAELAGALLGVMFPEAYAYHARDLAETPEKYPTPLRNRLLSGALFTANEYVQAQRARSIMRAAFAEAMRSYDVLLTSSTQADAATYAESISPSTRRGPNYNGAFNMTGQPAIAIPSGFSGRGLPLSLMISGRPFAEATVLRVAHAFQQATDWHKRHPDLDAALAASLEAPAAEAHADDQADAAAEAQPDRAAVVAAPVDEETVRRRAALAGVSLDEECIPEAALAIEGVLKTLRRLDPHAIRRVEPAVAFTALGG
ncbi:MAG TPA: amidase [Dehalococcoidia bacterium]|nr:amidase [Dehalococcoidia bacterium]